MEIKYLYRDVTRTLDQSPEAYRVRAGPRPGGPDQPHASDTGCPRGEERRPQCRRVGGKPADSTAFPPVRRGCSYHSGGGCSLRSDPKGPQPPSKLRPACGCRVHAGSSSSHTLTAAPDFSSLCELLFQRNGGETRAAPALPWCRADTPFGGFVLCPVPHLESVGASLARPPWFYVRYPSTCD